jgi:2-methylisocitrate lyase-like PEP mutase family enzyme
MSHAATLRSLHVPGSPVVLPNVWDAGSAGLVAAAGFPAIATSSSAVGASLGPGDGERMTADEALAVVARVASAVSVPVTADLEAGYGLEPADLAQGLLAAGAVGCNLEDTERPSGALGPSETSAARIAAVRAVAGDAIVINARADSFARSHPEARHDAIERGRRYLDAGADCIYPITASDERDIAALVEALGVININLGPRSPSLARLAELGVARVSLAGGLFRYMTRQVDAVVQALRDGDDSAFQDG